MRVKGAVMSRYWMGLLGILMLVVYLRGQEPLSKGDYLGATTLRRGTPEWDEIEESLSGQVPKQVLQMHSENQRIMPKGMDTTDFPLKLERINWIERKSAKHLVLVAFSDRMGAKLVVYEPITSKDFVPVWVSSETLDQGLGRIQVEDINQDEKPEIMAYTAKGAHSLALYLYTWDGLSAKLLNPNGDTSRAFFSGDAPGVEVKDEDGDGIKEILCFNRDYDWKYNYIVDYYKWDGKNYIFWKQEKVSRIEPKNR